MKAPEFQWGPREDRFGKKYTAVFALEDLLDHGLLEGFVHDSYKRGDRSHLQYFHIRWRGESADMQTAVHATDYVADNGGVPIGIERALIADGKVNEVLILCGEHSFYYRIPVADWLLVDPNPKSRDRFTSVVDSSHSVNASGRSIHEFAYDLEGSLNSVSE